MSRKPITRRSDDQDRSLVLRAQGGDRDALGELFMRHAPTVRRLLGSIVGPTADLDDIVQDIFIQVHRSLGRFRGDSRFSTWLHQVTVYTAYNYLRRPRDRGILTEPSIIGATRDTRGVSAHDRLVSKKSLDRLNRVLDKIKPKKRVAFILYAVHGYSAAEVAEMVGAPLPTVKSRIWFARRELLKKARRDPYLASLLEELEGDDTGEG